MPRLAPKTLFVSCVETVLEADELTPSSDGSDPAEPQRFWDDFLLLPVDRKYVDRLLSLTGEDVLRKRRDRVQLLFRRCADAVDIGAEADASDRLRRGHALELLFLLLHALLRKKLGGENGFEVVELAAGVNEGTAAFTRLFAACGRAMAKREAADGEDARTAATTLAMAVKLLLLVGTHGNNLHNNVFLEMMPESMVAAVLAVLARPAADVELAIVQEATLLLALLVQYRADERSVHAAQVAAVCEADDGTLTQAWLAALARLGAGAVAALPDAVGAAPTLTSKVWGLFSSSLSGEEKLPKLGPPPPPLTSFLLGMLTFAQLGGGGGAPVADAEAASFASAFSALMTHFSLYAYYYQEHAKDEQQNQVLLLLLLVLDGLCAAPRGRRLLHTASFAREHVAFARTTYLERQTHAAPASPQSPAHMLVDHVARALRFRKAQKSRALRRRLLGVLFGLVQPLCEAGGPPPPPLPWNELFESLLTTAETLAGEADAVGEERHGVAHLLALVLLLLLAKGDCLFATASDYDALYYHIVRRKDALEALAGDADEGGSDTRALFHPCRAIARHFHAKVEAHEGDVTREAVLLLIHHHYDSLSVPLPPARDLSQAVARAQDALSSAASSGTEVAAIIRTVVTALRPVLHIL